MYIHTYTYIHTLQDPWPTNKIDEEIEIEEINVLDDGAVD
jgi:hypothetical protein